MCNDNNNFKTNFFYCYLAGKKAKKKRKIRKKEKEKIRGGERTVISREQNHY